MKCKNCVNKAVVKGRCRICYNYWRRTGNERPARLAEKQAERNYRRFHRKLEVDLLKKSGGIRTRHPRMGQ